MHPQLLEPVVVAAGHPETLRLRMRPGDGHLHAYHVETLEHAVVRLHQKRGDAIGGQDFGLYIGEVEHRQLARIGQITDAVLGNVVDDG